MCILGRGGGDAVIGVSTDVTSRITIYAVDVNQKSMHLQIVKGKF